MSKNARWIKGTLAAGVVTAGGIYAWNETVPDTYRDVYVTGCTNSFNGSAAGLSVVFEKPEGGTPALRGRTFNLSQDLLNSQPVLADCDSAGYEQFSRVCDLTSKGTYFPYVGLQMRAIGLECEVTDPSKKEGIARLYDQDGVDEVPIFNTAKNYQGPRVPEN
ncbi:MAG: hypothetical protein H6861_07135 [Rhodospirillales bacterium]|nr:hypothetical protein [Rhodospirillales bacterium]